MPVKGIDDEDRLVPIAYRPGLWFFSRGDGRLYFGSPGYRGVSLRHLQRPFVLPGDSHLLDLSIEGDAITVTRHRLGRGRLHPQTCEIFPLGLDDSWSLSGVVPGSDGSRHAVLLANDATRLVDLRTGYIRAFGRVDGATVSAVLACGVVVNSQNAHAIVGTAAGRAAAWRPGRIVSIAGERFLVKEGGKDDRRFHVVENGQPRALRPPGRWSLIQVELWRGGFVATCLHPRLGYGLWDGTEVERTGAVTALYAAGPASPPFVRVTGVSRGSEWRLGARAFPGVALPRPDLAVVPSRIAEIPTIHIRSRRRSRKLLVSLHGGPDSHEWDDLRFGGAYRALLDSGFDILVINYRGSSDLGRRFHRSGWRSWQSSVDSIVEVVERVKESWGYDVTQILGVSFGAWLAVQVADRVRAARVTAVSPIFALATHLQSHSAGDPDFARWARDRFGERLEHAVAGDDLLGRTEAEVVAIVPHDDEVVSTAESLSVAARMRWRVTVVDGAHYPATPEHARQRWAALVEAVARR